MIPDQFRAYHDQALQRWLRGEIGKMEYDELEAKIRELEASSFPAEVPTPSYEPGEETRGAVTRPRALVPARLQAGELIEKYRLESMQRGGMGEVWQAWDTKGERYVALKFLPPELSGNKDEIARIRATFKLVEQLDHPHICRVFDLNEHPQWGWYQVMRWIDGQTLSQYQRALVGVGQPLPLNTVVELLGPAANALDYAHERKVLHRDIKPQNLMRDQAGQVTVIDFGLAAEVRGSLTRVRQPGGDVAGTRPYLAPEQWDGAPASTKTDQYALGVTAYELLSGRWPFESNDTAILARAVQTKPVPAIDGVSDGVMTVLRKVLAKRSEDRFPNCREFVKALATPPKPKQAQPPLLKSPFSMQEAAAAQQAWAVHLGRSAIETQAVGIKLALVPPGEFLMGSSETEAERSNDEQQHRVRITRPFYLGVFPVTQGEYVRVIGTNPSYFRGDERRPVENVSWDEATEYCQKLTETERAAGRLPSGWNYRLPTESEWEYACRVGTATKYSFGDDEERLGDYAWFKENSGGKTHPVGEKSPNAWGLYDLHGNVWEWCTDSYGAYQSGEVTDPSVPSAGSYPVFRGGGWNGGAWYCRSADRCWNEPSFRDRFLGFRLALSPSGGSPEAR
jgi:formylglycine-generating enzyme required for sulfatase activity